MLSLIVLVKVSTESICLSLTVNNEHKIMNC